MKRKVGFFIIFFLVQISCGHRSALHDVIHTDAAHNDHYILETSRIVILPFNRMEHYSFREATAFKLTNSELALVDEILNSCVAIRNVEVKDTANLEERLMYQDTSEIHLPDYKRQYIPFKEKDGKKKVWVNCFYYLYCNQEFWKTNIVKVRDGGNWNFKVLIDLDAKQCLYFIVNGLG